MFLRYNIIGLIWGALIFALLIIPGQELPSTRTILFIPFDAAIHIFLYSIFALFLTVGFKKQYTFQLLRYKSVISAIAVAFIYGMIIEVIQEIVIPDRSFEFKDILANFTGSIFGAIIFIVVYSRI